MVYIFKPGKFNDNTWFIGIKHKNTKGEIVGGGFAAYLVKVENGKKCLINPGPRSGVPSIYKKLKKLDSWPLDMIIITHSHWDHTQGIIFFREITNKENLAPIKVMASEKAIPYLNNQSYNQCFTPMDYYTEYLNIPDVSPLKNREKINLSDDFTLEIIETPGHMEDHISIYDKQNNALFVGDTPGIHWYRDLYVCNANSKYWKEKEYLESMKLIKSLNLDYLCIAHYGVFTGEDISRFIDNSIAMYYKWQDFFDQNSTKLDDLPYLLNELWKFAYKDFSEMPELKQHLEGDLINAIQYYKNLKQI
jgi:glyoxylase-like metal-dependent hydrolase (beta-lactamase superfamily II)